MSRNKSKKITFPNNKTIEKEQDNKQIAVRRVEYSGPIPPAEELRRYNTVIPNAAERILTMAEDNQKHQIDIENKALLFARQESRLGQIFAFLITILLFLYVLPL